MTPKQTYEEIKRLREKERSFSKKISEIPWLEVARAASWAIVDRGIRQKQLAREWGMHDSTISLLIASIQLPGRLLNFHDRYPRGIFLEIVRCPSTAVDYIGELMERGESLTCQRIRDIARSHLPTRTTQIHDLVAVRAKATRHLKDFFRSLPKGQAKAELRRIVAEIEREEAEAERLGRIA